MYRFACSRLLTLASAITLLALQGCSVVSGWFPDKHKQYQYSTEIAALEIPPDMTASTIDGVNTANRAAWQSPASAEDAAADSPRTDNEYAMPPSEMKPESADAVRASKGHAPPVLAQSSQDVPLIEVQAPFEITWAEVNKALGRLKLEITDQNRSDGVYFVQYGGKIKPYEDRGFFGDVQEMFSGSPDPTQEFQVKLEQKGSATSIFVLNMDGKPQHEGLGLELLKHINDTLQTTGHSDKDDKPAP